VSRSASSSAPFSPCFDRSGGRCRRPTAAWTAVRWPEYRLTVELDSYTYHHTRHAWEHDRRREREARARGDEFRRYTYGDVTEDRQLMLAELCELLPELSGRAGSRAAA
jgi:hypothetical protein